ncbi:MAG TPA: DUF58 domain-containing protein [Mucilaginibacter sp.]|nr:DUF58 domain-containing protein [Mucilaginibacter sp.]
MIAKQDILKNVRKIGLRSQWISDSYFAGQFRTAFKGTGIRLKEVREYQPGDDVRFIDWNVTARHGQPYVKVFEEERDLPVYLLADISASTHFGSTRSKKELIAQVIADLTFSAISVNQSVGLVLFSSRIELMVKPNKTYDHFLYLVTKFVEYEPSNTQTDLSKVLQDLSNILPKRSLIFVISDFADQGYENALCLLSQKHNVIGLQIYDLLDQELPISGWLQISDPENGDPVFVNVSKMAGRHQYARQFSELSSYAGSAFKKAGNGFIRLRCDEDHIPALQELFLSKVKG